MKTHTNRYNLIVIGGGAAGLTVAGGAALLGARVALIERARLGGECLHDGCVPSKALLHVARIAHTVRTAHAHGVAGVVAAPRQDLKVAMDYVRAARARIAPHDSAERFAAMGVEVIEGDARLRSAHEVDVAPGGRVLWGRHVVIATGSRPRIPDVPGLVETGFLTNETVFDGDTLPGALLVIGGGPIGVELGQAFDRLGSSVTIVNEAAHLLPREDADVAEVLTQRLRQEGVAVWNGSAVSGARRRDGRKEISVTTPEGARTVFADEILVAAGRRPSVEGLGLASVGVAVDEEGIRVDRACRTSVRSIWAVGDVTHTFRFTHWASHQARLVLRNTLLPGVARDERDVLPWATFTDPEVARVGLSEREAQARGLRVQVHRVPFEEIDRAVCDGATEGFAKVLTRRGRIVGAAIVHAHAGELIGALALAQRQGTGLAALARAIHVYPTLGDVHRALGDDYVLGRITPRRRAVLARVFAWLR